MHAPRNAYADPPPYVVGPVEAVIDGWSIQARIAVANRIAALSAQYRPIRELAQQITRGVNFMPSEAPESIAAWIRSTILYQQEEREALQGPFTTLPPMRIGPYELRGRGAGDCDDLAILFASLCRAVGIRAWVVGVGPPEAPGPVHAVGMDASGTLWELISNRYGGDALPIRADLPHGWRAWSFDPEQGRAMSGRVVRRPQRMTVHMRGGMAGVDQLGSVVADLEGLGLDLPGPVGQVTSRALSAAGTAAAVGGQAASLATSLGLSAAAVPVVGWAVAGAALVGVGVGALIKAARRRRAAADAALNVREWIEALEQILSLPEQRKAVTRLRLLELIPAMAGTGVPVATYDNQRAPSGLAWADGTTGTKEGVLARYRRKANDQAGALAAHAAAAQTFARALAGMPVLIRQGALRLALETYMPGQGLRDMQWLPPVPARPQDEGPTAGGTASAQRAPLWPWIVGAGIVAGLMLMED